MTDQLVVPAHRLPGSGYADHQVFLSGQTVQQREKATEQSREQARLGLGSGLAHPRNQVAAQGDVVTSGCERLESRARLVGGQLEHGHLAREAPEPEVFVALELTLVRSAQ